MELLLFGVAIAMYGIWRLSLAVRGEDYTPQGKWTSRTDAMSEYMEQTNPGSTRLRGRRLFWMLLFMAVHATVSLSLAVWLIRQAER